MSKLAIFLCFAIFASAAKAGFWYDELQNVQSRLDEVISGAINQVRAKFELAKEKADQFLAKLNQAALDVTKKTTKEVENVVQKVQDFVKKVTDQGRDVDVSVCRGFTEDLDRAAVELYKRLGGCVDHKVRTGISYLEAMHKRADRVINDLKDLRQEGLDCGNDVDSVATTVKAVFCKKMVASKAVWTATKAVPSLTLNFGKMSYLLSTLQPSLSYCAAKNTLVTFVRQAHAAVVRVEKCVREKLGNAYKKPKDLPTDVPWSDLGNETDAPENVTPSVKETTGTKGSSEPEKVPTTEVEKVSTTEVEKVSTTEAEKVSTTPQPTTAAEEVTPHSE